MSDLHSATPTTTPIRWRNETGRVIGGYVEGFDEQSREWLVYIPNWITSEIEHTRVAESDAVVGNVPWPNWM